MARRPKTVLTASSVACLFTCPRKYYLSYIEGWRRIRADEALRLGSGVHKGLETRANGGDFQTAMEAVLGEIGAEEVDAVMTATVSALLAGYFRRYEGDAAQFAVEPEREFAVTFPFLRGVVVCGKMDGVVRFADGRTGIIEHKTTAQDIGVDSDYWQSINRDQIALYKAAAEKMGLAVDAIVYDVIKKPGMKPFKATPPEKRKYRADGTLYASCHEADETADSWLARVSEDISGRMDEYYARREIPLLSTDMDRLARRLFAAVRMLKCYAKLAKVFEGEGAKALEAYPRCGSSLVCKSCPFRGLCDGGEMPAEAWERGRAHEELEIAKRFLG